MTDPEPVGIRVALASAKPLPTSAYKPLGVLRAIKRRTTVRVVALAGDGSTLVSEAPASSDATIAQGSMFLHRSGPNGPKQRIPSPAHASAQQVIGADINAAWIVWMETTSAGIDVQPWHLYAYNRRSRTSSELAHSPSVAGLEPPPPPGFTGPLLAGGSVFWAQVGGRIGAERVDVFGCRVSACEPTRYAAGAAFPSISGNHLYVISTDRYAGHRAPTQGASSPMTVRKIDLRSRKTSIVTTVSLGPEQSPAGLAVAGHHALWIIGAHPSTAVILDLDDQRQRTVDSESEGLFGFPIATPTYVAWAESSGTAPADVGGYLLRPSDGSLWSIGNTAGLYDIHGAGSIVAWQDSSSPAARLQDIHTTVARLN
jgi:hypothetical protein